jgi:hypothetical protein
MLDETTKNDIALTNCILSVLRTSLRARCELYVKWWAAKAFNGAVYSCEDSLVEVHFYSPVSLPRQSEGLYAFRRGTVRVIASFQEATIEHAIAKAEENFDATAMQEGQGLLERVVRLQFSVSLDISSELAYLAALSEKLLALFGGELRVYSSSTEPSCIEGVADLELTLAQPLREPEVMSLLDSVWPERIGESLFGFGLICLAQKQPVHVLASCHLHITGRQF